MPGTLPRVPLARALVAKFLTDTCQVTRGVVASDDAGGSTETPDTPATVACAVEPLDVLPQENAVGGRVSQEQRWRVHMPAGTDVQPTDQIVVTSQGNRVFNVVGVAGPETLEVERIVICREVK